MDNGLGFHDGNIPVLPEDGVEEELFPRKGRVPSGIREQCSTGKQYLPSACSLIFTALFSFFTHTNKDIPPLCYILYIPRHEEKQPFPTLEFICKIGISHYQDLFTVFYSSPKALSFQFLPISKCSQANKIPANETTHGYLYLPRIT